MQSITEGKEESLSFKAFIGKMVSNNIAVIQIDLLSQFKELLIWKSRKCGKTSKFISNFISIWVYGEYYWK